MVDQDTFRQVIEKLDKNDQHLANVIDSHSAAISDLSNNQSSELQKQALKSFLDHLTKTSAHLFDSASKYSNLVSVAGYAAFFAIWNGTKENINSELVHLISVLLVGVSASVFVFFETYKMLKTSAYVQRYKGVIEIVSKHYSAGQFKAGLELIDTLKQEDARHTLSFARSSRICQIAAISTGLLGTGLLVGVLGYSILKRLMVLCQS